MSYPNPLSLAKCLWGFFCLFIISMKQFWASEMTHWVVTSAAKSGDLSVMSCTKKVEEKYRFPKAVLWPPHMYICMHACACVCMHTHRDTHTITQTHPHTNTQAHRQARQTDTHTLTQSSAHDCPRVEKRNVSS